VFLGAHVKFDRFSQVKLQHDTKYVQQPLQESLQLPQMVLGPESQGIPGVVCCNVLQCHYSTLQHTATAAAPLPLTLQHTSTHCNTLQQSLQLPKMVLGPELQGVPESIETHCNTLQHTATHCNTLQHTATNSYTLQHTTTHYNTLQLPLHFCRCPKWCLALRCKVEIPEIS